MMWKGHRHNCRHLKSATVVMTVLNIVERQMKMNGFIFTLSAVICITAAFVAFAPADSRTICSNLGVLRAAARRDWYVVCGFSKDRRASSRPNRPVMLRSSNMSAQQFLWSSVTYRWAPIFWHLEKQMRPAVYSKHWQYGCVFRPYKHKLEKNPEGNCCLS